MEFLIGRFIWFDPFEGTASSIGYLSTGIRKLVTFGSTPEVDLAYDLVQQFAQMLRTYTGEHLDAWLTQVESSDIPELQSFASGIEKDKDTVRNGLTWSINNGIVERHVTKLKLIKRQGYGKAGFPRLA